LSRITSFLNALILGAQMDGSCNTRGQLKIHIEFMSEDLNRKDCLRDISVDERIIVKGMFKKYSVMLG
jgi:hypothetical protein